MLTLIVFIGSCLFAVYFLASAFYVWAYRTFFKNYSYASYAQPSRWKKHFWNYKLDYALKEDWRLFVTIAILAVIAAICFAVLAWSAF